MQQPAIHLLGSQTEGNGSEELRNGYLALPIVGRSVTHLGRTLGHRLKNFKRRHQFSGTIDLDLQPTVAHPANAFGKHFRCHAETGKVLGPGGRHTPGEGPGRGGIGGHIVPNRGLLAAANQPGKRNQYQQPVHPFSHHFDS